MRRPEEAALRCARGHGLRLTRLPDFRKRLCAECREAVPRLAPRYSCCWCAYNVCYGCAAQFPCREWKQSSRKAVAISKFYDIVAPADGELRQHCHSRKGFAISEDCRSPEYSDADLTLTSQANGVTATHDSPTCQLAADIVMRGMQLLDVVGAEVERRSDWMDRDWRPELPPSNDGAEDQVRPGNMLSWLLGGGDEVTKIKELCDAAQDVLQRQPVVSEVQAPARVFGDIHGQLRDLLLLFHFYGRPGQAPSTAASSAPARRPRARRASRASRTLSLGSAMQEKHSSAHEGLPARKASSLFWGRLQTAHQGIRHSRSFASLVQRSFSFAAPSLDLHQEPPQVSFVFNGDFVDRGLHQLEVVVLLLALKVMYPSHVFLNRGNHEDRGQNLRTSLRGGLGFDKACMLQFPSPAAQEVFEAVHGTFDWLPLAARVGGRILVLHGGLGSGDWTLEMLGSVERPWRLTDLTTDVGGMVYNALWSDPLAPDRKQPVKTFGVHTSHRTKHNTVMKEFGRDVTESFCKREGVDMIIRSHQFKQRGKGYELMHDGLLMRVFSARNYCGTSSNDSGILLIGFAAGSPGTLLVRPQNIERVPLARGTERAVAGDLPEPYCPNHHLMHAVRPRPPPGCMSLSSVFKPEMENVECNVCGAEELENGCYFSCRGCSSYDMCLDCASQYGGDGAPRVLPTQDRASSKTREPQMGQGSADDSTPASVPTLLTARAGTAKATSKRP